MLTAQSTEPYLLAFDDPALANALFGPHNAHLVLLSSISGAKIDSRGSSVSIYTDDENIRHNLCRLFIQLYAILQNGQILDTQDFVQAYKMLANSPDVDLHTVFCNTIFVRTPLRTIKARNLAQKVYFEALQRNEIVFATGPAGTGKTYLAVAKAIALLQEHKIRRIVLTRPAVEAGERLGFLPGDLVEKINPYLRPLYDALYDMLPQPKIATLLESGTIEIAPLAFMRGRTLNDAFIILDEAQNTTCEQMKMFLTRMGNSSRMVITGDITQIDLPFQHDGSKVRSGLVQALQILPNVRGIAMHHFHKKDIVRHTLVEAIVGAYDEAEKNTQH